MSVLVLQILGCVHLVFQMHQKKKIIKKKHRRKIIIECRYRIKMGIQGRHILLGHAHWEPLVTDLCF